jgi:Tfp pilus assembly protein PilE
MKYETKQLKSGFSHFETVLLVVVIAVIATVGFAVYQKNNKSKADTDLNAQYMDAKVKGNFETFDSKTASDEESQSANYALSSIGDYQDAAKAENNKGIMASSASAKRKVYWIPYRKKPL